MKEVFDKYIEISFGEKKQADFKFEQFSLNYRRYFPENKNAVLLDVGIGRGEMLSCMKKWGYVNHLGIDISPSTVNFCRSIKLNCELVGDTIAWVAHKKETFELITLLDVLEHIKKENTIPFLKAVYDSLKDEGILIVQVPNLQAPDGQLHRYNDITHEVGYIENSLRQVLLAAGFNKIEFYGFEDILGKTIKDRVRSFLRSIYWLSIRFVRKVNGNLNPRILYPVFFAVASKKIARSPRESENNIYV